MKDHNRPRLYLIRNPYDPTYKARLVESKRIEPVYPLAPMGGIVKRARDRELYAAGLAGIPIEVLGK